MGVSKRCSLILGGGVNKPDECVDLDGIDIVEFLQSLLDLSLVGLDVDDEYKSIVLLNLLHSTFRIQRMNECSIGVHSWCVWNRFTRVLWVSR